ncbi:Uma2 family endonuclease [Dyadobacter sp. 32]|uniref:Uma2 family endonuclease n=1 Tax=Dyadobacter sp. 32 TaxID=538966 RepID=UPI0039C75669
MLTQERKKRSQTSTYNNDDIPDSLIYEVMDGEPLYYKGYKDVLSNKKSLDDIMGSSTLQSFIITYLLKFTFKNLDEQKFLALTNELGLHVSDKTNFAGDINIFDRSVFSVENINKRYSSIAPKIVCEVDSKIDFSKDKDLDYINIKTQKLLNFGVEKVIWIFTGSQKVMVSQQNHDWLTKDWNQDIELLDGHFFNIGQYLKDEGVKVETNF